MNKKIVFLSAIFFLLPIGCAAIALTNPLPSMKNFTDVLNGLLNIVYYIAVAITPIFLMISAFYFMAFGGNPEKINQAKQMFFYAIVGLIIAIGAKGFVALITGTLVEPEF